MKIVFLLLWNEYRQLGSTVRYFHNCKAQEVPVDRLIRGHIFIEPVPDYGELGCSDLFSKKLAISLIIPIK